MATKGIKSVKFSFPAFIIAFSAGLLYVYLFTPHKEIIVKYPNPYNSHKVIYQDKKDTDTCYKYDAIKVKCPDDKSKIIDQPLI